MSSSMQPFLIVGSGRCGTTFVYDLLRVHPRVALTNEAHVFDFLYFAAQHAALPDDEVSDFAFEVPARLRGVVTREYASAFSSVFDRHARPMIEEFYAAEFPHKEFTHFGDKMPMPIPAAAARKIFPELKYVALVRDPRDYVCSAMHYARLPHIAGPYPHLDLPLARHCEHWAFVNRGILEHLDTAPLRYEELRRRPEDALRAILELLELPPDPACVEAIARNESFATHGTSPDPLASIGRWKRELDEDQVRLVEEVCGPWMEELGYHCSMV